MEKYQPFAPSSDGQKPQGNHMDSHLRVAYHANFKL